MRTMNVGKLNKRLKIMKLNDTTDQLGQKVKKLTELKTVWGSLYPVRGGEYYEVQKIQSKISHKCYIRFLEGVDTDCYIEYQGKQYNVISVIDVDLDHKMLEIMCEEHHSKEVMK